MKYLQFIQYFYIIAAILFAADGLYALYSNNGNNPILSFLFSGAALFMFFFRRRFKNRFDTSK